MTLSILFNTGNVQQPPAGVARAVTTAPVVSITGGVPTPQVNVAAPSPALSLSIVSVTTENAVTSVPALTLVITVPAAQEGLTSTAPSVTVDIDPGAGQEEAVTTPPQVLPINVPAAVAIAFANRPDVNPAPVSPSGGPIPGMGYGSLGKDSVVHPRGPRAFARMRAPQLFTIDNLGDSEEEEEEILLMALHHFGFFGDRELQLV